MSVFQQPVKEGAADVGIEAKYFLRYRQTAHSIRPFFLRGAHTDLANRDPVLAPPRLQEVPTTAHGLGNFLPAMLTDPASLPAGMRNPMDPDTG